MIKVQTFVTNSHNTADHNKLSNGINNSQQDIASAKHPDKLHRQTCA